MAGLTFSRAYQLINRIEGGYSNHPNDPGGPTMGGVTQATYDSWRSKHGLLTRPVKEATADERATIFEDLYWRPCGAEACLAGGMGALAFVLFDAAVHEGVRSAVKRLQKLVGATVDGKFGPQTLAAAGNQKEQPLVQSYINDRTKRLMMLTVHGLPLEYARKGFLNRMKIVSAIAGDILTGGTFV